MKNVSYAISGVLAVAIIVLFVLFFTGKNVSPNGQADNALGTDSTKKLAIAYVDTDSLLSKYDFAKVESERLMNKFKSSESTIAQKKRQLQSEYAEFETKRQNNQFISQDKAQQEIQRIQKLEMDLQQMAQRIENELAQEEMKINVQIADSVRVCLKEFNKTANYDIIFSNKRLETILIAKDSYDVTTQVVTMLNNRYKQVTPAPKK